MHNCTVLLTPCTWAWTTLWHSFNGHLSVHQNISILDFIGANDDGDGGDKWSSNMCFKAPVRRAWIYLSTSILLNTNISGRHLHMPRPLATKLQRFNKSVQRCIICPLSYKALQWFIEALSNLTHSRCLTPSIPWSPSTSVALWLPLHSLFDNAVIIPSQCALKPLESRD